jgi:hypothetical protein
MTEPHALAVEVLRIVCDRLRARAPDLQLMAETTSSFEEWLNWEAFLACKARQAEAGFCEVAAKPPYSGPGGESATNDDGTPFNKFGDLRVGASYAEGDHRWVFAEFALLHDGNRPGNKWQEKIEADAAKLRRLRWVNSISMLVVVVVSQKDVLIDWGDYLGRLPIWSRPALTAPASFSLPGGGSVLVKAFDVKQKDEHVQSV